MIIDIIIIAFILLSVFWGYKQGFTRLAIKLVALIIAVVATFFLYEPITNFIVNTTRNR